MTKGRQRRAAVLGGIGLFMIAGAIWCRVAPSDPNASAPLWVDLLPVMTFLIGLVLFLQSGFNELLKIVKEARKSATDMQKAQLRGLTRLGAGLLALIVLAGVFVFSARLADGRFGWGSTGLAWAVYLTGFVLLATASLLGTWARFREIEILSDRI